MTNQPKSPRCDGPLRRLPIPAQMTFLRTSRRWGAAQLADSADLHLLGGGGLKWRSGPGRPELELRPVDEEVLTVADLLPLWCVGLAWHIGIGSGSVSRSTFLDELKTFWSR